MSGLEVFATVASAVQLAQVSLAIALSLKSLITHIRDAKDTMQFRLQQIENLIAIANIISDKPHLQTPEIHGAVQRCLKEAETLKAALAGPADTAKRLKKLRHVFGGLAMENKIVEIMARLEREKSALVLCISTIDSSLLHGINTQLYVMQTTIQDVSQEIREELPQIRTAMERLELHNRTAPSNSSDDSEAKSASCLSSFDPVEQNFFLSQTLNRSQHGCHWFRQTTEYTTWLADEGSGFLCVTARAGCGKTTLAAHVSQWVASDTKSFKSEDQGQDQAANSSEPIVLIFFYQKANQEAAGNAPAALRSAITQLVQRFPDLLSVAIQRYESLSSRGNFLWTWESLWAIFLEMLEKVPNSLTVYLILDAMDECDNESRQILLSCLGILAGEDPLRTRLVADIPRLKILLTSRPDEHIFDKLSSFTSFEIKGSDTSTDMKLFIDNWISSFSKSRRLSIEVAQTIGQFLHDNAQGMFLWVVLITEELERRDERLTNTSINSRLRSIPLTLVNTYKSILLRPPTTRKSDMWRILRWLLYGKRGLTVLELETALCLETESWLDFAGDLHLLCGSLVRFDGTRGEINLVHQTARDFLESFVKTASHDQLGDIPMEAIAANTHLAEMCVQFLLRNDTFLELEQALLSIKVQVDYLYVIAAFLRRYPFICYAVESWAAHIHAVGPPPPPLSSAIRQLLGSQLQRDGIMRLEYYIRHYGSPFVSTGASALHLAAYFDFHWLVDEYIAEPESTIDILSIMNDSPLIWACETGGTASVEKLLAAGADPNVREADGWTALHWAARNGHLPAAELLLEYGARIGWLDSEGLTALEWAAMGGYCAVFDLIAKKQEEVGDDDGAGLDMVISFTTRSLTAKFEEAFVQV